MADGRQGFIGLKVALCNVCIVRCIMHQDVIPGLVFWWSGAGHLFIPFIRALELRINVDYNAPIVKQLMVNQLTR